MFSKHPLPQYVINMYEILVSNYFILPNEIKTFLPFFIINNWLESYTSIEGIEGVLRRMTKRTSLPNETPFASQSSGRTTTFSGMNSLNISRSLFLC
jgi:acyl carrier protein phosphodiesterase